MAEFNFDDFFRNLQIEGPAATMQLPDPDLAQYWEDLKNRIVWINDEITENTLDLVSKIIYWNREDKDIPVEARKPIRIIFFSPGGSLDVQDTLVSMIKLSKTPIYGVALGMVASAASMIYLATHKHYALPNAYFILHRGSCQNISGDYANVQNAMEDYRRQVERLEKFYIENTKIPEEVIKEKLNSDWYVRGEKTIEYGLVDEWVTDINTLL